MSTPRLAQRNHEFAPDDGGFGCTECPLPERNRIHRTDMAVDPITAAAGGTRARPGPVLPSQTVDPDDRDVAEHVRQLMTSSRQPSARATVFRAIAGSALNGMTDDELLKSLLLRDMSANTVRPRRVELARDGLIEMSGSHRATATGNSAVVWVVSARVRDMARRGQVDL